MVFADNNGRAAYRALLQWNTGFTMPGDAIEISLFTQSDESRSPFSMELFAEIGLNDSQCIFDGHASAVRACTGHCVEGVADTDDAAIQANLLASKAVRVS